MSRRTNREIAKWFARNPKVGLGLGAAWLLFAAAMSLRTLGWKETQGQVMAYEAVEERVRNRRGMGTRTRTGYEVAYQYDVGNERFTGSNIYPFWNVNYRAFGGESNYRPGQRIRVIYNAGNPSQAALTRSMSPDHLIAFVVMLGFMVQTYRVRSQHRRDEEVVVETDTAAEGDASGAIARAKARAEEARARKAQLASKEQS